MFFMYALYGLQLVFTLLALIALINYVFHHDDTPHQKVLMSIVLLVVLVGAMIYSTHSMWDLL